MKKLLFGAAILILATPTFAQTGWDSPEFALTSSNVSPFYLLSLAIPPNGSDIPNLASGSWSSQDGLITGTFTADPAIHNYDLNSSPASFPDFSSVAAEGQETYTITAPQGGSTTIWQFNADWSSINPALLSAMQPIVPTQGQIFSTAPAKFSWSLPTGYSARSVNSAEIFDSSNNLIASTPIGASTSWSIPALAPGSYVLNLSYTYTVLANLPVTTNLISGTDQMLPFNATVRYQSIDLTNFVIAPEPATVFVSLVIIPLLLGRRYHPRG